MRHIHEAVAGDLAATGQARQNRCSCSSCANSRTHLLGHTAQLVGSQPSGATRQDQRVAVGVCLFRSLVEGIPKRCCCSSRHGKGVDQAQDVAAQGARCRAKPAEHILELAALLQGNHHDRLASDYRREDISELSRYTSQRRSGSFRGHACTAQRGIRTAQGSPRLVNLPLVLSESIRV
ncbi:hypothetical protein D3C77_328110 [compost metagenome]